MGPMDAGERNSEPDIDQTALKALFVTNVKLQIFGELFGRSLYDEWLYGSLTNAVATATHMTWEHNKSLGAYVGMDYAKCLAALVACYQVLQQVNGGRDTHRFDQVLADLINECCQDLHLRWERGHFVS